MMRTFLLFFAIVLTAGPLAALAQIPDPNFHIYLLAGQSNMAGRGAVDSISNITDPQIFMLDKAGNWVLAKDPVHFDKSIAGVGPAISFAKEMLKGNKDIKIGLVPTAVGGSPIKAWQPDSVFGGVHPYNDAINRTKKAMERGVLKGILWHQGESDNNAASAAVYLNNLNNLIARFRTEFKVPDLPFVAGETGYFLSNGSNLINDIIRKLPATTAGTEVVSASGLTDKGDKTHFDTPSARVLGFRYALAMKRLQAQQIKK